jgi:hypothetical protein
MRKLLVLATAFIVFSTSFASTGTTIKPALHADKIFIPVGTSGTMISLQELADIKVKDLEKLTGNKMRFFDKLAFKSAQRKLRNSINNDGTISNKRLEKYFEKAGGKQADGETGFHVGGFALGLLLGLIGVLIAYLINDDKKRNRRKWAWIGWGVWVVFVLLFLI